MNVYSSACMYSCNCYLFLYLSFLFTQRTCPAYLDTLLTFHLTHLRDLSPEHFKNYLVLFFDDDGPIMHLEFLLSLILLCYIMYIYAGIPVRYLQGHKVKQHHALKPPSGLLLSYSLLSPRNHLS